MTATDLRGDDLDDGLDYDVDVSDNEDAVEVSQEEEDVSDTEKGANETEQVQRKKRKPQENKLKEKKRLKMELDVQQKRDIVKEESTQKIADWINQQVAQKNRSLTSLELSDLYLAKGDLRSTSDIDGTRNLDGLAKYIGSRFGNMLPKLKGGKKGKESDVNEDRKFIAIVSMSAIRACDVHRAARGLGGSSLKLINKNKIAVDLKLVKTTVSRILCCTPGRLQKVLEHEESALKKEEVKIIILDHSYLDQKYQNVWDVKETISVLKDLTKTGAKIYLY